MRRPVRTHRRIRVESGPAEPPLSLDVRTRAVRLPRTLVERAVATARALRPRRTGALSVALVDDRTIRRLHRDHMGLDSATDVLAFPLDGSPGGLLGEVVASAETARREARARGHDPRDELLLYLVHGLLHLLGFDDHTPAPRRRMRAAERRVLRAVGVTGNLFPSAS